MVYPTMGRVAYMFFVTFWSVVMSVLWKLDSVYAWTFVVYSILSGVSVILFRSAKAEQINYKLFQVRPFTLPSWLSIKSDLLFWMMQVWKSAIFTIPGYYRYVTH